MNQSRLLELAKQGNVDAIATLLCCSLEAKGIQADVRCQSCCLEVVVAAPQLPPQESLAASIRSGLISLQATSIHRIRILGRPTQSTASPWTEEIQVWSDDGHLGNRTSRSTPEPSQKNAADLSAGLVGASRSRKKSPTPIHWPPSVRPASQPLQANRSPTAESRLPARVAGSVLNRLKPIKKSWLAVNLSILWPGLGQVYANAVLKGVLLAVGQIVAIAIALWSIFDAEGNTLLGLVLCPVVIGIWFFSLFDAHYSASRFAPPGTEPIPRQHKDPWFAVFLSQVIPGLGHLYSEKIIVGAFFFFCAAILIVLKELFPSLLLFPPLLTAVACYHAYVSFPQRRRRSTDFMLAIAAAILLVRLTFNYTPTLINQQIERFIIPSESMLPTLKVEDRIFVSKSTRYRPKSGDIIVFQPTDVARQAEADPAQFSNTDQEKFYVKRIIGQPGQTIQISQGKVYLNGQLQDETYLREPPSYEWGPETIPANSYFVLGDNRNRSADSHLWGFLPQENIVGKAYKIYWPPHRVMPLL